MPHIFKKGDRVSLSTVNGMDVAHGTVTEDQDPDSAKIKVLWDNDRKVKPAPFRSLTLIDAGPTTIFPVTLKDQKVHAAFVMDYRTDQWATMCGKSVPDPTAVDHRVTEVTCTKCAASLTR